MMQNVFGATTSVPVALHLPSAVANSTMTITGDQSSHPNFGHLTLLVFEAVMEVVCVSLPGYIVARMGMFDANSQKFVAELNISLFPPCLIFSKIASQLNGDRLVELGVIPVILLFQTLVSWASAQVLTRVFHLRKLPQANFVTAMAVFGNSNSLPLSLVVSLAHTISGLHWDQVPGDNDDEVAARGILYLLVFSQLGQIIRWSWGMIALLKPLNQYTWAERGDFVPDEEDSDRYKDAPSSSNSTGSASRDQYDTSPTSNILDTQATTTSLSNTGPSLSRRSHSQIDGTERDGRADVGEEASTHDHDLWLMVKRGTQRQKQRLCVSISTKASHLFNSLPSNLQNMLNFSAMQIKKLLSGIWGALNVPLAAIIVSVVVALVPSLQKFFFTPGTFVNNSVTSAIDSMGGVAVPLILVVLGANLAQNTLPKESVAEAGTPTEQKKMLYLSLICRMVIPVCAMAPLLAVAAKYVPISTLDDPIFLIVCFLLAGAPSALQLAQMCQVNEVYVSTISRLLFHSYVIWILPSTLVLVLLALEVVEWASV